MSNKEFNVLDVIPKMRSYFLSAMLQITTITMIPYEYSNVRIPEVSNFMSPFIPIFPCA